MKKIKVDFEVHGDTMYIIWNSPDIYGTPWYYVTVRPASRLKYNRELLSDLVGRTSIHPRFLDNRYYDSVDSCRRLISTASKLSER